MGVKPMYVQVCTWDPSHTLQRVREQREAQRDGTIAKLVKKHGKGTDALRSALQKARLVTMTKSLNQNVVCPECGALMERLLVRDGIVDKEQAIQDIAENMGLAIERTRQART